MIFKYNQQDDVLMIELNKKSIDYAEQNGDMIVHFSPRGEAVLIEVLDASQWLKQMGKSIPKKIQKQIWSTSSAIAHRIK